MASAATSARDAWIATVVDDEERRRQLREAAYCLKDFIHQNLESLEHTLDLRSWPPLARMRFIDAWQRLKDGSAVDPLAAVVPAPAPENPFAGHEAPTPQPVEPAPPRAPSPLPAPAVVSPEGPLHFVASPATATTWTCTACFSTNDDEDSACVVCQGPRPGVAAPSRDGNLEALMADYVYGFGNAPVAPAPAVAPPPLHGPTSPRDPDRRSERRPERPNAPPPPPRPACTACLQIQNRGKAKKAHTCPYVPSWPAPEPMMMIPFYRPGYGGSFAPPAWPPPTCTMPSRPVAAANDVSGTPSSVEAARHAEPPATWWTGADALSGKVYYYNTMTGAASPTWPPQI